MIVCATIPAAEVPTIAPFLKTLIDRACSRDCDVPSELLVSHAAARKAQLWVASDDYAPIGVTFTRVVELPEAGIRAIWVPVAGGFRGMEWIHEMRRVVHEFRVAEGASYLIWHGRKGWGRVLGLIPRGRTLRGHYIFEDRG